MRLAIYGMGGSGKELLEMIEMAPDLSHKWNEIIFIDDTIPAGNYRGHKHFSFDEFKLSNPAKDTQIAIALGEPMYRSMMAERAAKYGYELATIIHPLSDISKTAQIGKGVIIRLGCVVSADAVIMDNTWLQNYVVIGHDAFIGKNCQISNFSTVSGHAVIGDNVYIGISAGIREDLRVGNNVIVAMGAMVVKDIPSERIAIGNPAHTMVKNSEHKVFK
jgi:sugar O-acyltransferase, sialic acid O-acetyltransferase NeuD family